MKYIKILIVILTILITSNVNAQEYLFKVLAYKGDVKILIKGSTKFTNLYIGSKINKGDIITLSKNSYLGLSNEKGKTMELKTEGQYITETLYKEIINQNATTNSKYVSYLTNQITKKSDENMAKNRYKYMSVVGSVERSTSPELSVMIPKNLNTSLILNNNILLKWNCENSETIIVVTNLFGDLLSRTTTKDSSIYLNLTQKNDMNFVVTIEANGKVNNFNLSHLNDEKKSLVLKEYNLLKNELKEETAINYIILSYFYEENSLYLEALDCYVKAIEIDDSEEYQNLYQEFLYRHF